MGRPSHAPRAQCSARLWRRRSTSHRRMLPVRSGRMRRIRRALRIALCPSALFGTLWMASRLQRYTRLMAGHIKSRWPQTSRCGGSIGWESRSANVQVVTAKDCGLGRRNSRPGWGQLRRYCRWPSLRSGQTMMPRS